MSKRISFKPSQNSDGAWIINVPDKFSQTGKRQRLFFETKAEAESFGKQERTRVGNYGAAATILTPGQLEEAAAAFEAIKPYDVKLNEVVQ